MKNFLVVICLSICFVAHAQLAGTTYAQAKASKKATWALAYSETPNFASKQTDGSVQGIAVEVIKKFAEFIQRTEGIKVTYEYKGKDPDDFNGFLQEVKAGKGGVFGLGNITITEARKKEYNFSPAFIKNISLLCTHKDVPTLTSLENAATTFANFKGIAVAGSTNEKVVIRLKEKYIPSAVIQRVESNQAAIDGIVKDKKSFTNTDFTFYLNAQRQGLPIKRHEVGDESSEEFGIIMPKSNDWSPLMAKFLTAEYLKSPEYKKILFANLGTSGVKLLEAFENKK
ncbi:MAG: transporter substrate-binding domain-containing protein [Bacteroidetes bacterium]|nr:transporter substrate-binding domain-containing protein [Bacteroidota bacterium]